METHPEQRKAITDRAGKKYRAAGKHRILRRKIREEVIAHYGGKCACCGETQFEFLAIDHINNDGAEHRRTFNGAHIEQWLKSRGLPEGFQVLCHNCNLAKGFYGECPHVKQREAQRNKSKGFTGTEEGINH